MVRAHPMTSETLVLPQSPLDDGEGKTPTEHVDTAGSVEAAVVVDPATYHRIDLLRDILQCPRVRPEGKPPAPNRRPDVLGGLVAQRGQETKKRASPFDLRATRPEGVSEKVEAVLGMVAPA